MQVPKTKIVEYNQSTHKSGLHDCVIELQDFEVDLDARLPTGRQILEEYVANMFVECERCTGKILIAEVDNEVAGYVMILTKMISEKIEDGKLEYALIADLVVLERFRRRGIGKSLLQEAESFARSHDVRYLRIGVLAANRHAAELYATMGFSAWHIELEKSLA